MSTVLGDAGSKDKAIRYLETRRAAAATGPVNSVRGPADWVAGLEGMALRFVPFNGGVGPGQLAWLRSTLRAARDAYEHVVVFTHVPVCPLSCPRETTLMWNFDEVLSALHDDGGDAVVAVFAGHAHKGGYAVDTHGIHHR